MVTSALNVLDLRAHELVFRVKSKDISVEQVMLQYLERIDFVNQSLNAIIQIDREQALNLARHIDKNLDQYQDKPLLGVPMTAKNFCDVKGFSPDKGCPSLAGRPSEKDATVVARLRDAGAIVLGLTNTPEFSIGYETDNSLYGQTKNPYNLLHTPGGSSGGEAAAIASQCSLLGIGSDLSGSLLVPAHNTGVTCLKMTQGRVPFTGSIPSDHTGLFSQFISCGPMARSVRDLMIMSPIMAGPDGVDPHVAPVTWNDPDAVDLSALKVAYYSNDGVSAPTQETIRTVDQSANALARVVMQVVEKRPDFLDQVERLMEHNIFLGGDRGKWLKDIIEQIHLSAPSPLLSEFLALAEDSCFSITELRQLWMGFDAFRKSILQFFHHFDVLICPVAATPAKLHGASFREVSDFSYSIAYSLSNCPVAVVRCGVSDAGLPIGLQIIAKPWREDIVLKVAEYLEQSLGGWIAPGI